LRQEPDVIDGRAPNLRSAAPACIAAVVGMLACLVPQAAVGQLQMQGQTLSLPPMRAPVLTPSPEPPPMPMPIPIPPAPEAVSPGFDCQIAKSAAELAICGDPSLAAKDRNLAAAYSELKSTLSAAKVKNLAASQTAWLRARDQCPASGMTACLSALYDQRTRQIQDQLAKR
jgi:uncharacterized protein YecT (DUF1311 family)